MKISKIIISTLFVLYANILFGQETTKLIDSVYHTKLDTADFIRQNYEVGRLGRGSLEFTFRAPDTVLYTIGKEKEGKVSLQIVNPKGTYELDSTFKGTASQTGMFVADTSGTYVFNLKNRSLSKKQILLSLKTVRTVGEFEVRLTKLGLKNPKRIKKEFINGVDTTDFLSHNFKLGRRGKEEMTFSFQNSDTVLYSFSKVNDFRTFLQIVDPKGGLLFNNYITSKGVYGSFAADTTGAYTFRLKNKSFKPNEVLMNLKTIETWQDTIIKVKPAIPITPPPIYDTIPEILIEELIYLAARKNIKSEYKKTLSFEFDKDVNCVFGTYVIAVGKEYPEEINAMVDLVTQEPLGDPLVAYGLQKIDGLPVKDENKIQFEFKGRGVNQKGTSDRYDKFDFPLAKYKEEYKIEVSNNDEIIGAYVYVKVVSFKRVQQTP